jgi:hypothetical protein
VDYEPKRVGWQVNDELERIFKKLIIVYLKYYLRICLESLRESMNTSDNQYLCQESNQGRGSGVRILSGVTDFSLPHSVQTNAEHSTSYPIDSKGLFLGGEVTEA